MGGCQQTDADLFCKITTCNEDAVAISYDIKPVFAAPGFPCPPFTGEYAYGEHFGVMAPGIFLNMNMYEAHKHDPNLESGDVVTNVVCKTQEQPEWCAHDEHLQLAI